MSSYSRLIILGVAAVSIIGCFNGFDISKTQKTNDAKKDLYLLMAIDSEYQNDYNSSLTYYNKLYSITYDETYLLKILTYSFKNKDFEYMYNMAQAAINEFPKKTNFYKRHSIIALVSLGRLEEALELGDELLQSDKSDKNYEIVANIYYATGNYEKSIEYYKKIYEKTDDSRILLKLVNILYSDLNKKEETLKYLESYIEVNGCSSDEVCNKIMLIYQELGDRDGMISILNKMYENYSKDPNTEKTAVMIQDMIVVLLEKQDINKTIAYLEKYPINNTKLLNLYEQTNQLEKALKLIKERYKERKIPSLLGRIAMLEFEVAKDKKEVLDDVLKNFELALSSGINNASYQNFYGYLLIDYDIDIQKGISLVKQALKSSPNNIAYLDSLAWGYFKLDRCEESKTILDKLIKKTETLDSEIMHHLNKVENCIQKQKGIK